MKREVLEETGIVTEFVSLVCFRHLLNFRFGCADIYFICHLKALSHEIKMDAMEIADAQWMDVSLICESPRVTTLTFFTHAQSWHTALQIGAR